MDQITKSQAEYIRKRCKELKTETPSIGSTCKDKAKGKRKKRYLTMTALSYRLLDEYATKCERVIYDSRFPEKYKNK